jgi:hypothetical protein
MLRRVWLVVSACTVGCLFPGLDGLSGGVDSGPDVSVADASWLGDSSRCTLSKFSLCDDFERTDIDAGPWSNVTPYAPTIDTTRAARGVRSMRIHFEPNDGGVQGSYLSTSVQTLFPARSLFVRAFVYVPTQAEMPQTGLLWFFGGPEYTGADFGLAKSAVRVRPTGSTSTATTHVSTTLLPLDRWACFEMEIFPTDDAGGGGTHVWLDDAPVADMTIDGGVDIHLIDTTELGVESVIAPSGYDIWVDEVAVDIARIGCAR